MPDRIATIVEAVRANAQLSPERCAFTFLSSRCEEQQSLSFGELHRSATALAIQIRSHAKPGERALLAFPPGLDFVIGFLGCLYAGVIAVPIVMPRPQRVHDASGGIVRDCRPAIGLSSEEHLPSLETLFSIQGTPPMRWIAASVPPGQAPDESWPEDPVPDAIAFLQYTSGSTSSPKGVMVSHANLANNIMMMTQAYCLTRESVRVSWLPLHHDMGLIFSVLQACYTGALCVLMSPTSFIKQPLSWLRAISRYRAELAIGTNFAFDLCSDAHRPGQLADVDLSCWKLAVNGAEPVRADTLERFAAIFEPYGFRWAAFHPGYGMAEATLVISGGRFDTGPTLKRIDAAALLRHEVTPAPENRLGQIIVGCGKALVSEHIAIVDPETRQLCGPGMVGEVWVRGPHIAQGYWCNEDATRSVFRARIAGSSETWLRTGDLGYLDGEGELYLMGRIKDLIIVKGQNFYPQDLERTIARHPAIRNGYVAAFGVEIAGREYVVAVCELNRQGLKTADQETLTQDIRESLILEHGLALHDLVFVKPGILPKTTSGKVRRQYTKKLWEGYGLGETFGKTSISGHPMVEVTQISSFE